MDIWRFPKMGVPLNHPFLFGNFPNKNHPAIGVPPIYGNPHIPTREDGLIGIFQAYGLHGTVNKTFNLPSKTNLGAENWKTPPARSRNSSMIAWLTNTKLDYQKVSTTLNWKTQQYSFQVKKHLQVNQPN